jgi:hypothetical protein
VTRFGEFTTIGHLFKKNYRRSTNFWATLIRWMCLCRKKCLGPHFGRFFPQNYPVTLFSNDVSILLPPNFA